MKTENETTCPECGQTSGAHKAGCYAIDFSECKNEARADWAQRAVTVFAKMTGLTKEDGAYTQIKDLLTDLGHLCDRKGIDWDDVVLSARNMYEMETDTTLARDPDCGPKCKLDAEGIKTRLEYLRGELQAECISYGELVEIQDFAARGEIAPDDVELLEAAGVPEGSAK